jgi:hypothetical protein
MNNAIEKILMLTRRRERFLVVAAVRFMRTIISRNVRPYWLLVIIFGSILFMQKSCPFQTQQLIFLCFVGRTSYAPCCQVQLVETNN